MAGWLAILTVRLSCTLALMHHAEVVQGIRRLHMLQPQQLVRAYEVRAAVAAAAAATFVVAALLPPE